MPLDIEQIRQAYVQQQPMYQRLAERVETLLYQATQRAGFDCEISARAKEIHSFVKKAIRKHYDNPLTDIKDKAAARIVATYPDALDDLHKLIAETFEVHHWEDKRLGTAYNELSYRGTHFEVSLRAIDVGADSDLSDLICEIQLRSQAEHLWSRVSHSLLYKPAEDPDTDAKRRIYRLIALLEIVDSEIGGARQVILSSPSYAEASILDDLEKHYYRFTAVPFDRELSFMLLGSLKTIYSADESSEFKCLIDAFVRGHEEKLEKVFADYQNDDSAALLHQPESLVVFERIEARPFALKQAWQEVLPLELLEPLANVWGAAI